MQNIQIKDCDVTVASASWVQVNLSAFLSGWYNGKAFSPSRLMKRLREARQPANFWMSHSRVGRFMLLMAAILSGLASIPRSETRKLSSWPASTPKTHLS